jgi:hypothetical protein
MSIITKEEIEARKISLKEYPLELFQHILCRYHFFATRNDFEELTIYQWLDLCQLIRHLDKDEVFFHVENLEPYPKIWKIKPWKESYEKFMRDRAAAEERRQFRFQQEEKLKELIAAVERDTGLDHELATMVARGIFVTENLDSRAAKAKQFGVIL